MRIWKCLTSRLARWSLLLMILGVPFVGGCWWDHHDDHWHHDHDHDDHFHDDHY